MATTVELRRSPRQHPPPSLPSHTVHRFQPTPKVPHSSPSSRISLNTAKGKERARAPTQHTVKDRIQERELAGRRAREARTDGDTDQKEGVDESCVATVSSLAGDSESGELSAAPPPSSLLSLLAHLSSSPLFSCTSSPSSSSFDFSPPPLTADTNHPPLPAASSSSPPSSPTQCTCKRPSSSPSPNAHIPSPERTKKRKIRHQFFRSSSLFTPPSASPSTSSPPARPRSAASDSGSAPSWWPSVSRSFGQGQESRFAPKEEEWTGDGEGWVAQLSLRLDSLEMSPEPEPEELPSLEPSKGRRRPEGLVRPTPTRSASSPAWLGQRIPALEVTPPPPTEEPKQVVELEGPALKQVLLKNLRARLASEGGTSKAGEAGLRFKKWVVWNSFNRRQRELFSPTSTSSAEDDDDEHFYSPEGDGGDAGIDSGDLVFDFGDSIFASPSDADDESLLTQEEFDFSASPSPDELPTPPAEGAAFSFMAEDPLAALASEDDSPFTTTTSTTSALLPAFDLPVSSPLSSPYTSPFEVGEDDSTPRSLQCGGGGGRPGLRRTTSLPNVGLSSLSSSLGTDQGGGWTGVQASGMVVACEG